MLSDKEVKKQFLEEAKQAPDKFYATECLKGEGFERKHCGSCGRYFWTTHADQEMCGDSSCQGGISIFADNPSKKQLSFTDVWNTFSDHMKSAGYTKIDRYPVVARWNPTTDFTMASIAAFQPYVISGEVEPVAKKLVIPQFCLRFQDVDNVGITGSHNTGFVMIGQHQFVERSEWDQNKAFADLLAYFTDVLGIPKEEFTMHEDAWAGGGNFGPCMEFFARGLELCNQVYMMFEQTPSGNKELGIKVLDMGLGQERVAWFTQGSPTMYDAAFPDVINKLKHATGVEFDQELYAKFAPYAALLNLDEVDDIKKAWKDVADKVGVSVDELRSKIEPMKAIYSIAEHTRALLVSLSDGALPGNVGGYYNLRVIYRRAQDFIDENNWDINLEDVAAWHADELKGIFPELKENVKDVQKILAVEKKKHQENRKRGKQLIANALKKEITADILINLYDSHGIMPEHVKRQSENPINIPDNFFQLVSEKHEKKEAKTQTVVSEEIDVSDVKETEPLFYKSYDFAKSEATVLKVDGNNVVLDRTVFYPTSGGQLHDLGTINDDAVVDVKKQAKHILHILKDIPSFKEGDKVKLSIDIDRRIQLAQHHTAAHVVNGAARVVLGDHIWQAGAAKTVEKGRLDITHFDALTDEEMKQIEGVANEVIAKDVPILKSEMKKAVAEQEHGFRLYQGGAVPGNKIRVIDIPGFDTEACGGTHLNTTGELQVVKLLKSTKVQDGVVRIEYVAGKAAHDFLGKRQAILQESMKLLNIDSEDFLAPRVEELFTKWKKVKKLKKKKKEIPPEMLKLTADAEQSSDSLADAAAKVNVQEEHLPRTIQRFLKELSA